jgi:hypothetical protein
MPHSRKTWILTNSYKAPCLIEGFIGIDMAWAKVSNVISEDILGKMPCNKSDWFGYKLLTLGL